VISDKFVFDFNNLEMRGFIDRPENMETKVLIVIIPGDGKTDIQNDPYYKKLRMVFTENGYACCLWDKIGCGKSKGKYYQIPIDYSANEAVAAINEIKKDNRYLFENIGLWGISRAGWICPIIISKIPSIAFWISVSGTNEIENFPYMLKSNFEIEGKKPDLANELVDEWIKGTKAFLEGASALTYLSLTRKLREDNYYRKHFGPTNGIFVLLGYRKLQSKYRSTLHYFDPETEIEIYLPNMKELLDMNCSVLAIFGEKDTVIDWKKTKELYEGTIGNKLSVVTFKNGNHGLRESVNGSITEHCEIECNGYYGCMISWLKSLNLD
jgi:alpha/beta superfamily hydrolase